MTKIEFLEQLRNRLNKLPADEANAAVSFYEEYFDEAGSENEQTVIQELGTPAKIASQIMAEYVVKESKTTYKTAKKGFSTFWVVILAVFASPIALPIAIAVVAVIFSVLVSVISVLFAIGVTGIALMGAGFVHVVAGIMVIMQSLPTALFFIGAGLFSIGAGFFIMKAMYLLTKVCLSGIVRLIGNALVKRTNRQKGALLNG